MTEESPTYTLRYLSGPNKIPSIMLMRISTGFGLPQAKAAVENQHVFRTRVPKPEAEAIAERFASDTSATIELIEEAEYRHAFAPNHVERGSQAMVRLRWAGLELSWERGQLGDWTRERTEQLDSVDQRDQAIAHASAAWTSAGLELAATEIDVVRRCSAREPALERVVRTLDSHDSASVYADWLQRQGDPRGLIIALDLARTQNPKNHALDRAFEAALVEHRPHLFGPLNNLRATVELTWQAGQIVAIELDEQASSHKAWPRGDLALLTDLLRLPICSCLRSLRITSSLARQPEFERALYAADPEILAGLRELAILPTYSNHVISEWSPLVGLEQLELRCDRFSAMQLPALTELLVEPSEFEPVVTGLRASQLPQLRTLTIDVRLVSRHRGLDSPHTSVLIELLALPLIAKLSTFRIVYGGRAVGIEVARALIAASNLRDVELVDLRQVEFDADANQLIRAHSAPNFVL